MANLYKYGYFGRGFVAGVILTILILTLGDFFYNVVQCLTGRECRDYYAGQEQDFEPEWWYWSRRLFTWEDTLAQWMMTFFSILGVGLIWRTLTQTNKTNIAAIKAADAATDANRIMRDEQRPWVTIEVDPKCVFSDHGHGGKIAYSYEIKNRGKLPARRITVDTALLKDFYDFPDQADIDDFTAHCRQRNYDIQEPILFGGETSGTIGPQNAAKSYRSWRGLPTDENGRKFKPHIEGDTYTFIVCITYEDRQLDEITIGHETRIFNLTWVVDENESDRFKLSEWFWMRQNS